LIADKPECNIKVVSDYVYLPYLNTTQIGVKLEGKCLKVSLANFCSVLRLKISHARLDKHDEKWTRPKLDLTRKYERASVFFEAWYWSTVKGISMLSAKIGERPKQVTARYTKYQVKSLIIF